jgi:hypothetical protein
LELHEGDDTLHCNVLDPEAEKCFAGEKSFDAGRVLGPADPILWEKEMWFAYGGFPIRHDSL